MKAAVLKAPGVLEQDDIPDPECPKGGTLIEVKACSICGTDVKMLQKGHKDLVYPRVLGHEIVGKVLEIDEDTNIVEGDIAQIWPGIACGKCRPCLRGLDNQCESIKILGFNQDGGFAKLIALPKESIFRGMNLVESQTNQNLHTISLAEPLACCLNGQELSQVSQGDIVLIIGGGPIGCLHAILAGSKGAEKIIIVERLEDRIKRIKSNLSCRIIDASEPIHEAVANETNGKGVDVILMATPEVKIDNSLLRLLTPGGRICIFSGPKIENSPETIDVRSMHYKELTLVGAYGCSSRHNTLATQMLSSGALNVDWVITKRTALENIRDAIDHSSKRLGLKSVIDSF